MHLWANGLPGVSRWNSHDGRRIQEVEDPNEGYLREGKVSELGGLDRSCPLCTRKWEKAGLLGSPSEEDGQDQD